MKIGYARVSTVGQDLGRTSPPNATACRAGDTLVVTGLDRLARSLPYARDIVEEFTGHGVRLVDLHRTGQKNPSDLADLFAPARRRRRAVRGRQRCLNGGR